MYGNDADDTLSTDADRGQRGGSSSRTPYPRTGQGDPAHPAGELDDQARRLIGRPEITSEGRHRPSAVHHRMRSEGNLTDADDSERTSVEKL